MREENLDSRIKGKRDRKLWFLLSLALFLIILFFAAMVVVLKEDKAARSDEDYYPGFTGEKSLPKERAGDKENLLFLTLKDLRVELKSY